ncbi:hybrid sensor histidine kinase/response regulator [Herbaspirillum sp. meg3]|uniref:hybrid sensor histidine kinase/response regulator n=1 Tax=Herbaspirillum sp. meg3 TaxID=2025949 RepID=UPI000B984261|nr:hybrid sensor histidine kinase/response regulator [Herbaspirillum sp. meg3]ASU39448.1 hybrid sensor histidine kinase/response regulator [Herbaspirillum sp. meg3]
MSSTDIRQMTMLELFRHEVESQVQVLNAGLLELEHSDDQSDREALLEPLEACMRAAHSLKGAARIISLNAGVNVAHVMEDCFVLAQQDKLRLRRRQIDALFKGVDLLTRIANAPGDDETWGEHAGKLEIDSFMLALSTAMADDSDDDITAAAVPADAALADDVPVTAAATTISAAPANHADSREQRELRDAVSPNGVRSVRVSADNLDRLLSLSGESLVESRRLKSFSASMLRLKRIQRDAAQALELLQQKMTGGDEATYVALTEVRTLMLQSQHMVADQLAELEMFDRHSVNLSQRLYEEALACRMRPFADGTGVGSGNYARMVRDVGHTLGKSVRLEIVGSATQIDRDILEKLDAPIGHLLRNAVDHGIESPSQRLLAGKPEQGKITLEARHSAGMLQVNVIDDGAGIDFDRLKHAIISRKLSTEDIVARLSESELLDFLLLPGFSLRDTVTEISGRGVGLDVVADMLKQVRGTVRITSTAGQGTRFQLQLPLTLSVIRSLLVSIDNEPYAFPLAYVNRTLELQRDQLDVLEGYQHFHFEGRQIGLVSAHQILQKGELRARGESVMVVVIGDNENTYGLAVDRFLGERMLVVQALDSRLGKIPNVQAGALMEDGAPVLILDVADMLRSVEKLSVSGQLENVQHVASDDVGAARKKVLVVDDSLTVRELERKLLSNRGYQVTVAVDGMDGWNAVRTEQFDLIITDIDMPRMDGIELVTLIRQAPHLRTLPVMIVSYKDREEDRQRGLEAGADHYFTKSSFHDETLLQAVVDLIGAA